MTRYIHRSVVVAGGGAVGLTLAMDLAWRGVEVMVIEARARAEAPPPKCNHISARSMEIYRRLGVAGKLRNAGLPADYPNDISYRTSFVGRELTRIPIPCRRDRYTATGGPDCGWPTPEPPHRLNQIFMEPILADHAAQMHGVEIDWRNELVEFESDGEGVVATIRNLDRDETWHVKCDFLIGCDGGRSVVRRHMGARLEGDDVLQRVQSTFIRAPSLIGLQQEVPAWATFTLSPIRSGNVYAIDGVERWVVHNYLREHEAGFDAVDRDWAIRSILGVGDDFDYEVLEEMDWYGRRLVANRFRQDRVFVCGDSAHIWVPYAGYGMNAGIADAANLAWLLAEHLVDDAPYDILEAYERERQPITKQVSYFVMDHAHAMAGQRGGVPENLEEDSPAGEAARQELGRKAYDLNVQQYCAAGLNFGYFYDDSPLIAYDGEDAPGYSMADFTPSTVPGCRLPHVWLCNGRSLYDALGPGYTLLRLNADVNVQPFIAAAVEKGVFPAILDLDPAVAGTVYDCKLILVRPDQHIAWRGNALPEDLSALIKRIRGLA